MELRVIALLLVRCLLQGVKHVKCTKMKLCNFASISYFVRYEKDTWGKIFLRMNPWSKFRINLRTINISVVDIYYFKFLQSLARTSLYFKVTVYI